MNPRSILTALLISLFVTTGCAGKGIVEIAVVHIPDPYLEYNIRSRLKIPTGDLHPEDMAGVSGLVLNGATSLEGLQYCLYLEHLNIYFSPGIDTSPIKNLPNIKTLTFHHCPGINIENLWNLTSLQRLVIHNCGIKDITPLEGLTEMGSLTLSTNEICELSPLRNMTLLTHLSLNENKVEDLVPLSDLTNLKTLDMHENLISNVDSLEFLIRLHRVGLSDNYISDITGLVENIGLGESFDPNPHPEQDSGDGSGSFGGTDGGYGGVPFENFDQIYLQDNPLSNHALNIQIPILQARGAVVHYSL